MKILVVSDTHGDTKNLYRVVMSQPEAKVIVHLGDGEKDMDKIRKFLKSKTILQVCGNCDIGSDLPEILEEVIADKKIFITHGNLFEVKKDLNKITKETLKRGSNIVLFGHTHKAINIKQDRLYMMNPGSLYGASGTYGIIDIKNGYIIGSIKKTSDLKNQNIPL